MRKLRIVQQYVAAKNGGGLETEFRALCGRETLTSEFDLIPVVLENAHPGISPADIRFYRRERCHCRAAGGSCPRTGNRARYVQ